MRRRQFLTVTIASLLAAPFAVAAPGFTKGRELAPMPTEFKTGDYVWKPEVSPAGPVVVVVSIPDQQMDVFRNSVEIGRSPVGGLRGISGSHAYSALATVDSSGRRDWLSVTSVGSRPPNLKDLAARGAIDPAFLAKVRALITPGTWLIVTDAPVNANTKSSSNMSVLTAFKME